MKIKDIIETSGVKKGVELIKEIREGFREAREDIKSDQEKISELISLIEEDGIDSETFFRVFKDKFDIDSGSLKNTKMSLWKVKEELIKDFSNDLDRIFKSVIQDSVSKEFLANEFSVIVINNPNDETIKKAEQEIKVIKRMTENHDRATIEHLKKLQLILRERSVRL